VGVAVDVGVGDDVGVGVGVGDDVGVGVGVGDGVGDDVGVGVGVGDGVGDDVGVGVGSLPSSWPRTRAGAAIDVTIRIVTVVIVMVCRMVGWVGPLSGGEFAFEKPLSEVECGSLEHRERGDADGLEDEDDSNPSDEEPQQTHPKTHLRR